jgi:superfamily II DNA/RNA helicase
VVVDVARPYMQHTTCSLQALPKLLTGATTIAAAETGSGKTLVYLLPILAKAWTALRPGLQGLVIAPSQELAVQICGVYDALHCKDAGPAAPAIRGIRLDAPKLQLASMVVGTPGSMLGLLESAFNDQDIATLLRSCSYLAFDEADLLLSASHRNNIESIVEHLQSLKTGQPVSRKSRAGKATFSLDHTALQCVAVAATLMDTGFVKPGSKSDMATASHWLHTHFRHAIYVSSSSFHQPSKLTDFTEVEVHTSALRKLVDHTVDTEQQNDQLSSLAQRAKFKALLQVLEGDPNLRLTASPASAEKHEPVTDLPHLSSLDEGMVHSAYFDKSSGESVVRMRSIDSDSFLDDDGADNPIAEDSAAPTASSILIFANDAGTVEHLAKDLEAHLGLRVGALHKDVPLLERSISVADWFAGDFCIMVATDLAARGLDTVNVRRSSNDSIYQRSQSNQHPFCCR